MPQQQQDPKLQKIQGEQEGHACDFCTHAKPLIYCRADAARLCLACDRHVHAANTVSTKHPRALLCNACNSAASSIYCLYCREVLCSNCDYDKHRVCGVLHDRRPVEGFSGCPCAAELVDFLGIGVVDEKAVDFVSEYLVDDVSVWENPTVLSLDELVVPTSVDHGMKAMGMPPLPKNRNSSCGKEREELIRQIRELLKSENDGVCDGLLLEQEVTDFHHEFTFQQGDLQAPLYMESRWIVEPTYEDVILENKQSDVNEVRNTLSLAIPQNSSAMNPTFLKEPGEVPPSASNTVIGDGDSEATVKEHTLPLPPKMRYNVPCLDRSTVISRYKEKRKTRRYDKLIRYESRKVRADSRLRIKGRFAKVGTINEQ